MLNYFASLLQFKWTIILIKMIIENPNINIKNALIQFNTNTTQNSNFALWNLYILKHHFLPSVT